MAADLTLPLHANDTDGMRYRIYYRSPRSGCTPGEALYSLTASNGRLHGDVIVFRRAARNEHVLVNMRVGDDERVIEAVTRYVQITYVERI